ncbi:hypothetical protein GCM10025867_49720 (plasmid) [Frondihabitans sucicola]|uniref:Uncharacterized protein n=1 Tax=Frondihabitans sucicola TaxID=1268041 RepID=A0ABM8GW69_9MICO|nr:hypothetical protein [Frondihabitans sucicola]BDZ52731.1 hypothetical protein GCM10025867_49720 [Frondihabitans sucicola]
MRATYDQYAQSLGLPAGFVDVGPFGRGGPAKAQGQNYRIAKRWRGGWRIYCPSGREGMFPLVEDTGTAPVELPTAEAAIDYLAAERKAAWALEARQRAEPQQPHDPVPQIIRGLETSREMLRTMPRRDKRSLPNPEDTRLTWAEDGPFGVKLTDEQRQRLLDYRDADDIANGRTPEPHND